ncbi:MAG: hypothetical protein KC731_40515 [Myxococcales bacterium]|nr:hypothetical protein [Myxococcales bacterium]
MSQRVFVLAALLLASPSLGCELVVGGYAVGGEGGSGAGGGAAGGGAETLCRGLPVGASYDFEGADPLAGLELYQPGGSIPGAVEDGKLVFDYPASTTELQGGRWRPLDPAVTKVSACFRARSTAEFGPSTSQNYVAVEILPGATYCGFFLSRTDGALGHLFPVPGDVADSAFGGTAPSQDWVDVGFEVDLETRRMTAEVGGGSVSFDFAGAPWDDCVIQAEVGLSIGRPPIEGNDAARMEFDDLRLGWSSN